MKGLVCLFKESKNHRAFVENTTKVKVIENKQWWSVVSSNAGFALVMKNWMITSVTSVLD